MHTKKLSYAAQEQSRLRSCMVLLVWIHPMCQLPVHADWVRDGIKAIGDYAGLPSTSAETKVLAPSWPQKIEHQTQSSMVYVTLKIW